MTKPILPAASFPPLQKSQGRGTHGFETGKKNQHRKDGLPARIIASDRYQRASLWTLVRKRKNTVSSSVSGLWWKRAGILVGLIGLAGIVWTSSLWYSYQKTLPHHPDPEAGRVYPLNVHGIVVYQTRDELNWLDEVQYSSIALFVVSALMAAIHQKKFGRPETPPKTRQPWTPRL